MSNKAITILNKSNLKGFKENAFERAKKFDVNIILPHYINYYNEILTK